MGRKKCKTVKLSLRIPIEWTGELEYVRLYHSNRSKKPLSIQDVIRLAIMKQFFIGRKDVLPDYKDLKPYSLIKYPKLEV